MGIDNMDGVVSRVNANGASTVGNVLAWICGRSDENQPMGHRYDNPSDISPWITGTYDKNILLRTENPELLHL